MTRQLSAWLVLLLSSCTYSFTVPSAGRSSPSKLGMAEDGFTTVSTDKYDIVKVDLDDGRDYPIYIGTGYDDEEGT